MNILVVGGGGREHAIIKKLRENERVETIYALPGNGGIALVIARIRGQILIGAELGGVDEKADHKTLGKAAALVHERLVTGMVIAHGGHKGDVFAGRVPGAALGRQILGIGEYLHIKVW